ncbi:hypothetical protein SynSYN20_01172 [Synechococcus sp. SYN20]|nr:hypothetical protein SynSYN20_01172 [Synechococcus sp. SYN20]
MTQAKQLIEILQRHGSGSTEIDLHQHPTRSAFSAQQADIVQSRTDLTSAIMGRQETSLLAAHGFSMACH